MKLLPLPNNPLLSIVITSYTVKRLRDLCELLDGLNKQTYPYLEVVIVIERSEELYERLKTYINRKCESLLTNTLLVFSQDELGISQARNLGVKNSRGNIIAFIDDDATPLVTWCEEIVKTFLMDNSIIGACGPILPIFEDDSFNWFPRELYWIIGCTGWKKIKPWSDLETAWGANMAFRREVFNEIYFKNRYTKGAHEKGKIGPVGDDREFSLTVKRATNKRIIYNPNMKVWHKVGSYKISSKFIRRYAFWQGYSDAMFKHQIKATRERIHSEYNALCEVILSLCPSIISGFFHNYNIAFKKLKVLLESIVYFVWGYFSYLFWHALHNNLHEENKGLR